LAVEPELTKILGIFFFPTWEFPEKLALAELKVEPLFVLFSFAGLTFSDLTKVLFLIFSDMKGYVKLYHFLYYFL
jgi:hypothetical protein